MSNKNLGNEISKRLKSKKSLGGYDVIKEEKLTEDTIMDLDKQEPKTNNGQGETLEEILDRYYERAMDIREMIELRKEAGQRIDGISFGNNPVFTGPSGIGKTSIIVKWAIKHNLNLVKLNLTGDSFDFQGVTDIKDRDTDNARAVTVGTSKFDPFIKGPSLAVLFIDEINKTNETILEQLHSLIAEHKIINGDRDVYLEYLLFTIGAMNPQSYGGGREPLNPSLKDRFKLFTLNYDTPLVKKYFTEQLDNLIDLCAKKVEKAHEEGNAQAEAKYYKLYKENYGRKDIIEKLFANPQDFQWPDETAVINSKDQDKTLSPRNLEDALFSCDGTKEDFIWEAKHTCGSVAASFFEKLLTTYTDKDHPAQLIWDKNYEVKEPTKPENPEETGGALGRAAIRPSDRIKARAKGQQLPSGK